MAKKILLEIGLDGDSEVKRKLQEVGEAGKRSLENISRKIDLSKNVGGEIGNLGGKLQQAVSSGLGGLAGGAGGGFLGGLVSKLTGPGGIIAGLGAAVTGALIASSKQIDERQRIQSRLSGLGDTKGFDRLTERAKAGGTDVNNLQSRYEKFLTLEQKNRAQPRDGLIRNPFAPLTPEGQAAEEAASQTTILGGGQSPFPSRATFGKFDSALLSQIRRDVKSPEDADRIAAEFEDALTQPGPFWEKLRPLQKSSPSAANFITSQLSKELFRNFANPEELYQGISQGNLPQLDFNRVVNAGAKPNPEFEQAARDSRGSGQGFEALSNAIQRQFEPTKDAEATNKMVGRFLDDAARRIDQSKLPPPLGIPAGIAGTYFNKDTPVPALPAPGLNPADRISSAFSAIDTVPPAVSALGTAASGASGPLGDVGTASTRASGNLSELATALSAAASSIRSAATSSSGSGQPQTQPETVPGRAGGGVVFGAGTATSDSIPAMLSNGEYVVNAAAASKVGLRYLDSINAGKRPRYFAGGKVDDDEEEPQDPLAQAKPPDKNFLGPGQHTIEPTEDGGAIIDGVKYGPESPILEDPVVKQALAQARAAKPQAEPKKHKSDFTGIFGGHVFDTPGSYRDGGLVGRGLSRGGTVGRGLRGFARGGYVSILPQFADGGLMDIDIGGAAPSASIKDSGSPWANVPHLGSMDLRTNHGDARVMGPQQTLKNMATAARDSADAQTGPRPSWYRGR